MTESELIELIEGRMPFPAAVGLDSSLFDDLGFDSILLLDLIVSVERESGCRFTDGDMSTETLSTPRKILELIARRSGQRGET